MEWEGEVGKRRGKGEEREGRRGEGSKEGEGREESGRVYCLGELKILATALQ